MSEVVLDASALLALLNSEPGADQVGAMLSSAVVSAVNLSEVASKLAEAGMPEAAIREALEGMAVEVAPFDQEQAYAAGLLRPATMSLGLSLGDRACLSQAWRLGLPAVTTDAVWAKLDMGVDVRVVR